MTEQNAEALVGAREISIEQIARYTDLILEPAPQTRRRHALHLLDAGGTDQRLFRA